jgi:feruloyl-CoA synthase
VVVAGGDRNEIGLLIFPNLDACRTLAADATADVTGDKRVLDAFRVRLIAFAKTSTGSSNCVCRAILLAEPPSLDAGEMTDKGSINQRAVLARRADLVTDLYAAEPSPRVLVIAKGT